MARKTLNVDTSWIDIDGGAYVCSEHRAQFRTIGESMAHDEAHHPERITVRTATPAQMAAGRAAMEDLRKAIGR